MENGMFRYFKQISKIPRGSGNEKGIADFLCRFAEENSLELYRDEYNNVMIKKTATADCLGKEAVLIQGHTDMVCEKNSGVKHDFLRDPIKLIEKDGWLFADGTTLGGDDGIAVAMMLEVLKSDNISHPDIECLFTTGEEVGLTGAENFDCSKLKARRIINLDSETEGVATASCAGSIDMTFIKSAERTNCDWQAVEIFVGGFKGGHSGSDIALPRKNAIKTAARLFENEKDYRIISLFGGNKRNAIPRECRITVTAKDIKKLKAEIENKAEEIRKELCTDDSDFFVSVKEIENTNAFSEKDSRLLIRFLNELPNGVIKMSADKFNLVETSSNLSTAETVENEIYIGVYARSSVDGVMEMIEKQFVRLAESNTLSEKRESIAAGWQFNPNSKLQQDFLVAAKKLFPERKAKVDAIHAGLECGIILSHIGAGDAISIGPDIIDIHTPFEKLDIKSTERTFEILLELLKM